MNQKEELESDIPEFDRIELAIRHGKMRVHNAASIDDIFA